MFQAACLSVSGELPLGGGVVCHLCGQTFLLPAHMAQHMRVAHTMMRSQSSVDITRFDTTLPQEPREAGEHKMLKSQESTVFVRVPTRDVQELQMVAEITWTHMCGVKYTSLTIHGGTVCMLLVM